MRFTSIRVSVRRLMIVVAIGALALQAILVIINYCYYQRMSKKHAAMEAQSLKDAAGWYKFRDDHLEKMTKAKSASDADDWRVYADQETRFAKSEERWARYHAQLKTKYNVAMRRPWRSIESDPPMPDWRP